MSPAPCSASPLAGGAGEASGSAAHTCSRPELRKLLDGLGLQDPQGFLFQEMMTWVQGLDADSKAALRQCCCQKLEEMIQSLQVLMGEGRGAGYWQWSLQSCRPPPRPSPGL